MQNMKPREKNLVLALSRRDLSAHARLVLITLILTGDETGAGLATIASQRDLAEIVGISHRSVLRAIQALERAGLVARTRQTRPGGIPAANMYTVLIDRLVIWELS